jgi:hypothetical protein
MQGKKCYNHDENFWRHHKKNLVAWVNRRPEFLLPCFSHVVKTRYRSDKIKATVTWATKLRWGIKPRELQAFTALLHSVSHSEISHFEPYRLLDSSESSHNTNWRFPSAKLIGWTLNRRNLDNISTGCKQLACIWKTDIKKDRLYGSV